MSWIDGPGWCDVTSTCPSCQKAWTRTLAQTIVRQMSPAMLGLEVCTACDSLVGSSNESPSTVTDWGTAVDSIIAGYPLFSDHRRGFRP